MQQFKIFRALGLSFKAWFQNFIPFTLLAAVLYAPVVIWLLAYDAQNADSVDVQNAYFLRPVYVLTGISTLLAPLLTYRVVQGMNGVKVSMLASIRFGVRGILPAVFVAVLTNLLQFVPGVGGIISAVVLCIWFVATPAAVAERLGTFAAVSRSAHLTTGRRWGIFGLTFLLGLMLVGLLAIWIIPLFAHVGDDPIKAIHQLRQSSVMFVITIGVFHLFSSVVEAVSYVLLREDKDGVSVQDLAKIFE